MSLVSRTLARFGYLRAAPAPIMFQSGETFSGMGTQPDASVLLRESLGWAAIATRALADRIASLEFEVVTRKRETSGTMMDEVIDDHPLKVLLDRPGRLHSRRAMLRLTTQYLLTVGEAYWLKVSGTRTGIVRELYVMKADRITPVVKGGLIPEYEVMDGQGRLMRYPAEDIIRFWLPDPETLYLSEGYLGPQGIDVDALKFASQHLRSRFQNDATPPTIITASDKDTQAPSALHSGSDMLAFEEAWRTRFHGVMGTKRGLPAWLPSGWDIKQLSLMGGQELVPLLEHWRDQTLMAFGVPRSVLGQVVSGDRSSAETNQYVFDLHSVQPIALMICDALTDQLAVTNFDSKIRVRFAPFVMTDKDYELRREGQDLTLKVRSINQLREDRGDDPVEWGDLPVGNFVDQPYTGLDVTPLQEVIYADDPSAIADDPVDDEPKDEEPPPEEDEPRMRGWTKEVGWRRALASERKWLSPIERVVLHTFAMQRRDVLEEIGKGLVPRSATERVNAGDIARIVTALGVSEAQARKIVEKPVRKMFAEVFDSTISDLGLAAGTAEFTFAAEQVRISTEIAARLVTQINSTTRRRLNRQLTEATAQGESVDQITKRINGVFQARRANARTIARTEVLHTSQRAQLAGFDRSGVVVSKRWNTSLDNRVRDSHTIDGQVVPMSDSFVLNDGELADAPGVGAAGGGLSAANTINCRCFLTPVTE